MSTAAPSIWDQAEQDQKKPAGNIWDQAAAPVAPAAKPYYGFGASNLYSNAKQGLGELGSGLYGLGKDVLFPQGDSEGDKLSFLAHKYIFDPADAENKKAQTAPTASESIGHSIAAAIPIVGPWAAGLGEQAGTGDIGGAAARGATQIAAGKAADKLPRATKVAAGMAQDYLGNALRDPGGDFKPAVTSTIAALKHPTEIPGRLAEGFLDKVAPAPPVHPGASLPSVDDFYENRGKDLMQRGRQQTILDRRSALDAKQAAKNAPIVSPFGNATSSETPIGNALIPPVGSVDLPKVVAKAPIAEVQSAEGVKGSLPKPSGRLVVLPEEARSLDRLQRIAKQRASEHGMQYAAGMRPAGGGRVPATPTGTLTTEYPGPRPNAIGGEIAPLSEPMPSLKPGLINGSGESSASQEAINRSGSEKANGVQRVRIDTRSGKEVPLTGVDAVDATAGPYDKIVTRDAKGKETIMDRGAKALDRKFTRAGETRPVPKKPQ